MTDEDKADWLYRNLFEDNQLVTLCRVEIENGKKVKKGNPFQRFSDHDIDGYWLSLLLDHIKGKPIQGQNLLFLKPLHHKKNLIGNCLGIYFGGTIVNNRCRSIGLDCDLKNAKDLLHIAQEAFPFMQFFQQANTGRWHAHGRVTKPVDARSLKYWLKSRLPKDLATIEVFPKTHDSGKAVFGNFLRLPMNPEGCDYEPVGELKDLVHVCISNIPVFTSTVSSTVSSTVPTLGAKRRHRQSEPERIQSYQASDIEAVMEAYPELERYRTGFRRYGSNNTESEFDQRFIYKLYNIGKRDPSFLTQAILFRSPNKTIDYASSSVANLLSWIQKRSLSQTTFKKPVVPIRESEAIESWLYNSRLFSRQGIQPSSRDIYFKMLTITKDKTIWTDNEWSDSFKISVRTLEGLGVARKDTIRKAWAKLRLVGLLRLVKSGKGKKGSDVRIRIPRIEEEPLLIQTASLIKESKANLLNKNSFGKLWDRIAQVGVGS